MVWDKDFKETPLENNLPAFMASIGLWYNDFYDMHLHIYALDILVDVEQALRLSLSFLTTNISINSPIISNRCVIVIRDQVESN
jgi:hypothetical protein